MTDEIHINLEASYKMFIANIYNGSIGGVKNSLEVQPVLLGMTDVFGWSPLHHAAYSQNADVVKFLLEQNANPLAVTPRYGYTYKGVKFKGLETPKAIALQSNSDSSHAVCVYLEAAEIEWQHALDGLAKRAMGHQAVRDLGKVESHFSI